MTRHWIVVAGWIVPLSFVTGVATAGDEAPTDETDVAAADEADEGRVPGADADSEGAAAKDRADEAERDEAETRTDDPDEPSRSPPSAGPASGERGWQHSPAELPPEDDVDSEDTLAPSSRAGMFTFDVGPSILMLACLEDQCLDISVTQVKLTQVIGGHLGGDGDGVGLGLGLSEAFGEGVFRFQPGLRLWGDIAVSDNLGVYIVPHAHVGYAVWAPTRGAGEAVHMFNFATGVGVKAVFADRISASVHPLGLDLAVGSVQNRSITYLWYDLAFGLGVTF